MTPHRNYTLDNGELRERWSINIHLHRQQQYVKLLYTPHRISSRSSDRIPAMAVWQLCCWVRLHAVCNQEFAFPSQESFFRCGCCCRCDFINVRGWNSMDLISCFLVRLQKIDFLFGISVLFSSTHIWTFLNQDTFPWDEKRKCEVLFSEKLIIIKWIHAYNICLHFE